MSEVNYRLAKEGDIPSISRVFSEAHDDLFRKRGFLDKPPTNPLPPPPIFAFLMRKTPSSFWIAEKEDDGEIVGFSHSFVRGSFWFFSFLFISPAFQGRNIGTNLLERTLASWKDVQITNRATITFAFNPSSQFLYMKYGMYPREPVYYAEGPSKTIVENIQGLHKVEFEEVKNPRQGESIFREIDESVLGFSLDWHHEYFFETRSRCYVFKDKGNTLGYAYVSPTGRVGPVAVASNKLARPVLESALELAASQGVEKVWYWMPGSNIDAAELALRNKMRLDPFVFMCTKPFAKWDSYIFSSAALM